jgi:hypothetical protein
MSELTALVGSLGQFAERSASMLEDDEQERFPTEASDLVARGVLELFIPQSLGGGMRSDDRARPSAVAP